MDQSQSQATTSGHTFGRQRHQEPEYQAQDLTQRRRARQDSNNIIIRPPSRAESIAYTLSSAGSTASRILLRIADQIPAFLPEPNMEGSVASADERERPHSRVSIHSQRSKNQHRDNISQHSESENEDDEDNLDLTEETPRPATMPGRYPAPQNKGKEPELTQSER